VPDDVRLTVELCGQVQGVGLRWWVRQRARELGLRGHARNLDDGRVEVVVEGPREDCTQLLVALRGPDVPGRPTGVTEHWADASGGLSDFRAE
jgi:acylphosphatase